MTDLPENLTHRMLRRIERTLAEHSARFDSLRIEMNDMRTEISVLRGEIVSLRQEMKDGFRQQHGVLAHNSVLVDEQAETLADCIRRIEELERK